MVQKSGINEKKVWKFPWHLFYQPRYKFSIIRVVRELEMPNNFGELRFVFKETEAQRSKPS